MLTAVFLALWWVGACSDDDGGSDPDAGVRDAAPPAGDAAVPTGPVPRGYQSRPCGFDLDDDGVVGELEDDCRLCDGITADPDGDGVDEDLIYVDCDAPGNDQAGCGSASSPCSSIAHAWHEVADGPEDDAEDILCFRGTCVDVQNLNPEVSGVAGARTRAASGYEVRDFEYPANPTMLVGWDVDGDGAYPPHDLDDTAVLDGAPGDLDRAFHLNTIPLVSYVELAHFTVRDYGRTDGEDAGGFIKFKMGSGPSTHLYLHDLSLRNINMDRQSVSGRIVFDLFGGNELHYLAIENVEALNVGPWFARGSGPWGDRAPDGPIRFQNISETVHVCDYSGPGACADVDLAAHTGFKIWGWIDGIEVLDSVWDANPGPWEPKPSGGPPTNLLVPNVCSRDWAIRNNLILDYKQAMVVNGYSDGYCDEAGARTVDDVWFDSNVYLNLYPEWLWGQYGVAIGSGGTWAEESIEDVTITNNFFYSPIWEGCIWAHGGNDGGAQPGTITIVNNTCVGEVRRFAQLIIGNADGADQTFMHERYVIANNIFVGVGSGNRNVMTTYEPIHWDAQSNVWDPEGEFDWAGDRSDALSAWQAASGGDASSLTCTPAFVDVTAGDLHLDPGDTCARNHGTGAPGITWDIDGQDRPLGNGWDVGADEVE